MSYNRLYYNSVSCTVQNNKIYVVPHFLCPICENRPQSAVAKIYTFAIKKVFDSNEQVTFTTECCSTQITLNVAVHKEVDANPQVCISVLESPIPEDWWAAEAV